MLCRICLKPVSSLLYQYEGEIICTDCAIELTGNYSLKSSKTEKTIRKEEEIYDSRSRNHRN